ncbi:MAG TPA: TIGR03118 family protein [Bryobacteraceae bacterium]|nr:TIGR03118 family protein [Bryobacteraceae bacterium]
MKNTLMLGAVLLFCASASAQTGSYSVSNIVTNSQDPSLLNPWGLSRASSAKVGENEWWTSNQVSGYSSVLYANGTIAGIHVVIPPASGTGPGSPTGTAANTISTKHVVFTFATLDGTISIWDSNTGPTKPGTSCAKCHTTTATIMVNNSASGASYQGLTIAKNATSGAQTYYAANANGGVEAYDATSFSPVTLPPGAFTDAKVPSTYTPAGIQAIGSRIYVLYNAAAGGGTGFVDAYNTNGKLLLRLQRGKFNQPWGIAMAPANFGAFSNMLLVGNTGSGLIGAYSPTNGAFQGFMQSGSQNITLPGLWGLEFGNGSADTGPTNVLYFNAGGVNQTTGVFGAITAQ